MVYAWSCCESLSLSLFGYLYLHQRFSQAHSSSTQSSTNSWLCPGFLLSKNYLNNILQLHGMSGGSAVFFQVWNTFAPITIQWQVSLSFEFGTIGAVYLRRIQAFNEMFMAIITTLHLRTIPSSTCSFPWLKGRTKIFPQIKTFRNYSWGAGRESESQGGPSVLHYFYGV